MKHLSLLTHALLAVIFFASFSNSQTVTVTRTRSNSSCYPSSPALSTTTVPVTVVVSPSSRTLNTTTVPVTIVVSPTPSLDAVLNAGDPFVITIPLDDGSRLKKRQARFSYMMANGNTTTNSSRAAILRLMEGRLYIEGIKMTVADGMRSTPFAADANPGNIDTLFSVSRGTLNWTNSAFTNGTAQFFQIPSEQSENAMILVQLIGTPAPELGPRPLSLGTEQRKITCQR